MVEPLPEVHLGRVSAPNEKLHSVLEPSFCVIAQGSKEVFVGDHRYRYDPFNYLLITLKLPRVSQVTEASEAQSYLSLRLELDPHIHQNVQLGI